MTDTTSTVRGSAVLLDPAPEHAPSRPVPAVWWGRAPAPVPARQRWPTAVDALQALVAPIERQIREAAELEADRGTPFLFVPVFLAAGALVYFSLPFEPGALVLGLIAAASAWPLLVLPRNRPAWLAVAMIALVAAGALCAKAETIRHATKMLGGEVSTRVTGRVVTVENQPNGRTRLTMDVLETEKPTLRHAPERVRLTASKVSADVKPGSIVEGLARLRPPSGPVRPGSYDFSFESYFDGIGASGFFLSALAVKEFEAPDAAWLTRGAIAIEALRQDVAHRIRERIGGAAGEIAAALMVGVRAGIPRDVSDAMRLSGLYHIISISGLHMALVAGTVMAAVRVLFALFPVFASRHAAKKYAAALGLFAIVGYLLISGGDVATQRSFLMLGIMLLAVLFDRAALTIRNLAISAILVIVWTPHEIVGPSFQMSYAATAALVGAFATWTAWRAARPSPRRDPVWPLLAVVRSGVAVVVALAATSFVAGTATAIYGAYHFQTMSPLSVFANLAATPIVSFVVVPAALMAAVTMPLGLDGPFLDLMGLGLQMLIAVSDWFAARSPGNTVGLISGVSVVLLTIALAIATMATTRLGWMALPVAVAGILCIKAVDVPDVLVSEDGKLVAAVTADARLAANRKRASGFTADAWQRATRTAGLLPIISGETGTTSAFQCDGTTCTTVGRSGGDVLVTDDEERARNACGEAAVIVLKRPATFRCAGSSTATLTLRDLARMGSASVSLAGKSPTVTYAIGEPARPWHVDRQWSRAARGLEERRSTVKKRGDGPSSNGQPSPTTTLSD
jgi:competence protein ComEC